MVNDEVPFPKSRLKGELICKLVLRYPAVDLTTIQLISHIQAISKNLSLMIGGDLGQYGLTEGKFYVLAFVFSEDLMGRSQPSPSQIADHLGVTRGTITGLLDGLERDGFLERFHDLRDRRGLTIRLTEKARTFLDSYMPALTGKLTEVVPLSKTEKQDVITALDRIDLALSEVTATYSEES